MNRVVFIIYVSFIVFDVEYATEDVTAETKVNGLVELMESSSQQGAETIRQTLSSDRKLKSGSRFANGKIDICFDTIL